MYYSLSDRLKDYLLRFILLIIVACTLLAFLYSSVVKAFILIPIVMLFIGIFLFMKYLK